jgi:hypothetical protein
MRKAATVAMLALLASLLMVVPALATHPEVSLAGSNFEIDLDANLIVDDDPPSIDWASVNETRQIDEPTGQTDDSFGEGTKEDTAVPTVIDGSIPNNKSDLLTFGVYLEENAAGKFLNVFWQRVQEPSGTTNMDFEFNKSETISANDVTPVRTEGDVLIQYDLASGGTHPELFLSTWITSGPNSGCEANGAKVPCWGDRVNLSDDDLGTGSINTSEISVEDSDGLATVDPISPRTFGEAQIDFAAFGTGEDECVGFGSAYLKSRSSDSFTAALKDFIAPVELNFSDCGAIEITKTAKHAAAESGTINQSGVEFTIDPPTGDNMVVETGEDGTVCVDGLTISTTAYTVTETVPAGYVADGDTTKSVTVDNAASCGDDPYGGESVAFSNTPLTDLTVTINSQVDGGTASTVDCVVTDSDPAEEVLAFVTDTVGDGTETVTDLQPQEITCTIVIDP